MTPRLNNAADNINNVEPQDISRVSTSIIETVDRDLLELEIARALATIKDPFLATSDLSLRLLNCCNLTKHKNLFFHVKVYLPNLLWLTAPNFELVWMVVSKIISELGYNDVQ